MTGSSTEEGAQATGREAQLVASILASKSEKAVTEATLETDQRVIARVTDGIYRQPGSALRELISNAYDADATRVVIKTDAPRFERISVEDNGRGMTPKALVHMLMHIGGSAKRSDIGEDLGVTAPGDPSTSPGGRRLIGKIGIGLFSVSQLTYSFQIITKVKGDGFRTIATVALRQYSDSESEKELERDGRYEAGKVNVWRERASDRGSQGTTIVLTQIRPQARNTLQSRDLWAALDHNEATRGEDERQTIEAPRFHIGKVDSGSTGVRVRTRGRFDALPWSESDSPKVAFRRLVQAVWDEVGEGTPNPQLDQVFDYYLQMVWQLSLAVPLPYVEEHPFDTSPTNWTGTYRISNKVGGGATKLGVVSGATLRETCALKDPGEKKDPFTVLFDALELRRPIRFAKLIATDHAIKKPLMFVGECTETFGRIPSELSGGPLRFEAYLLWTPKVVPKEHQGSLIRIHGSSGTLFDPHFMRYQVSEQVRLRQIVCEVFVSEGLESALNIDRESFNGAHPHVVYITRWLHNALRQLATTQKKVAGELRETSRGKATTEAKSRVQAIATTTWQQETEDEDSEPPAVEFTTEKNQSPNPKAGYVFDRTRVLGDKVGARTQVSKSKAGVFEEKLKAIAQVLSSFGVLDKLTQQQRERLLRAIREILESPDQ